MDQNSAMESDKKKEEGVIITSLKSVSTKEKQKLNFALQPNLPEKIVICIDVSEEMGKYYFSLKDKQNGQSFREHVIIALTIHLRTKVTFNANHQFAILLYADTAFWVSEFTRDIDQLVDVVRNLPSLHTSNNFDISIIFNSLLTNVHLDSNSNPPSHIYRTILIYGRHHCVPNFNPSKYKSFKDCCTFIMDVLYLCNPETSDNHCEIFESFCQLDFHDTSYIMAASEGSEVLQGMAQMLGHPLQRPLQKEVSLALNPLLDS